METMMNEYVAKEVFSQAEKFFKDARVPEHVQALMQDGVAKSRELYTKGAAATQDGAKVLSELADTTWSSTKMLNDKVLQNVTANAEATFEAAHAIAKAKSLAEVAKIQTDFVQQLATKTTSQTKEFFDLSARATQHVFDAMQAAVTKSMKSGF
jgi:phasin family protein